MDLALEMEGFDEKDLSFITKPETRTFTDEQCARLLAASFLGLVSPPKSAQFTTDSTIVNLFKFDEPAHFHSILQYFEEMHQRSLELGTLGNRKVSFVRRKLTDPEVAMFDPKQAHRLGRNMREYEEGTNFTEVDLELEMIDNKNTIEDGGYGMLNADFANKRIGGGVLRGAKVQEEISFLIHPECLVSLLLCTEMGPTESIAIVGAERFSRYLGYANGFKWDGAYEDHTPIVKEHKANVIVAFDAINYRYSPDDQFTQSNMRRELIKAYSAFSIPPSDLPLVMDEYGYYSVATGNWGCGAFNGDIQLKFMIQWIAASLLYRGMAYFPFDDKNAKPVPALIKLVEDSRHKVHDVWMALLKMEKAKSKDVLNFLTNGLQKL
eukprot:776197_1